jgi:hypothetical protein
MARTRIDLARDVQKDPYEKMLSQQQLNVAHAYPQRILFSALFCGVWASYFLSKHKSITQFKQLKFSGDMIFALGWRMGVGAFMS